MPFRQRGSYGRSRMPRPTINSIKNVVDIISATVGGTNSVNDIAIATNNPLSTTAVHVENGCIIRFIDLQVSYNGTAGTGVNNRLTGYLFKNPGANLTPPNPGSTGTSNEKKFVVREWMANLGRVQDGATTFTRNFRIKIPKVYWRMGVDDKWSVISRTETGTTSNYCLKAIYKRFF